jgi:hypothetical protein
MTQIIPVGHGNVVFSLRLASDPQDMAVTIGIRVEGEFTLNALAAYLHDSFGDHIMNQMANVYTLVRTEVQFRLSAEEDLAIGIATGDRVGAGTAVVIPQNSAFLVHKRTARAGRRGRGRFYLPGVQEAAVDAIGALTSGTVTGWQTSLNLFLDRLSNSTEPSFETTPVLLHQDVEGDGSEVAELPDVITALVMDPIIATQRRRLRA